MIDAKLLDLLVCPVTKGKLEYDREKCHLVSHQAGLVFPVIDGIPNMRIDTAISLDEKELDDKNDASCEESPNEGE